MCLLPGLGQCENECAATETVFLLSGQLSLSENTGGTCKQRHLCVGDTVGTLMVTEDHILMRSRVKT